MPGSRLPASPFDDRGKEMTMEREPQELVELGTVTTDTAGDEGLPIESGGRMLRPGLVQD